MSLKSLLSINFNQWCWLIEAYFRLWRAHFKIKLLNTNWLRSEIEQTNQGPFEVKVQPNKASAIDVAVFLHESVRLAARLHLFATDCLPKSIVLKEMLVARGINAQLCLGVNSAEDNIKSHAWVEVDSIMIGEPETVNKDFHMVSKP